MPTSAATISAEFVRPSWSVPLRLSDCIEAAPAAATVKGMFFAGPLSLAEKVGKPLPIQKRYVPFKDYPLREHLEVLAGSAEAVFPQQPLREGLRRLGRSAFVVFGESLVGKTVLGIAGRSWSAALHLVARAYKTTGPIGTAEITDETDQSVVVCLRNIWNFADSYHVGVFEGAMEHYERPGEILVRTTSLADVDLKIVYR